MTRLGSGSCLSPGRGFSRFQESLIQDLGLANSMAISAVRTSVPCAWDWGVATLKNMRSGLWGAYRTSKASFRKDDSLVVSRLFCADPVQLSFTKACARKPMRRSHRKDFPLSGPLRKTAVSLPMPAVHISPSNSDAEHCTGLGMPMHGVSESCQNARDS